jgi:branched-chain amino acid transport system permease protein
VGMGGAIWAYFTGSVNPASTFDPTFDVAWALMGFLGGMGTIAGPILGAIILEPTRQIFTILFSTQIQIGQAQLNLSSLYLVIYGAFFLAVLLLLPQGVVPTVQARWIKYRALRRDTPRRDGAVLSSLPERDKPASTEKEGINL